MTRVLLGQLCSNGDCLYATILARQIKDDFPGCHLTWAVSSLTKDVLVNNPDVDEIMIVPIQSWSEMENSWNFFEREAMRLYKLGYYDEIFLTQISPANLQLYDGTIRPSILRGYGRPITVPIENTIVLTDEKVRTNSWFARSRASDASYVAIMECSSKSGQSFMTPEFAIQTAEKVLEKRRNMSIIISTHEQFETDNSNIISGHELSMRETAQLTHHADLFIGCGSGLTVVATSTAAQPELPNIQILNGHTSVYASFRHDFDYFGKPSGHFLEMTRQDLNHIAAGINAVVENGIEGARPDFDEPVRLDFAWYISLIDECLVRRGKYVDAAQSLTVTAERYGLHSSLREFGAGLVTPFLEYDLKFNFPGSCDIVENYKQIYA